MRVAPKIVLSSDEIRELEKLARGRRTSVRLAQRSAIVLLAAEGNENKKIRVTNRNLSGDGRALAPTLRRVWHGRH